MDGVVAEGKWNIWKASNAAGAGFLCNCYRILGRPGCQLLVRGKFRIHKDRNSFRIKESDRISSNDLYRGQFQGVINFRKYCRVDPSRLFDVSRDLKGVKRGLNAFYASFELPRNS